MTEPLPNVKRSRLLKLAAKLAAEVPSPEPEQVEYDGSRRPMRWCACRPSVPASKYFEWFACRCGCLIRQPVAPQRFPSTQLKARNK